jgi:phosphate starvation-inducible PhoH-like protein
MRGRTLSNAAIILDEAQNTTASQMLMFLTRLGHDSKMIVTGDVTQVDLPGDVRSGLLDAMDKLANIRGIARVELERGDIVRHRLVQNIVDAYEQNGDVRAGPGASRRKD